MKQKIIRFFKRHWFAILFVLVFMCIGYYRVYLIKQSPAYIKGVISEKLNNGSYWRFALDGEVYTGVFKGGLGGFLGVDEEFNVGDSIWLEYEIDNPSNNIVCKRCYECGTPPCGYGSE